MTQSADVRIPVSRTWIVRRLWLLAGLNALAIGGSWSFNLYYRVTLAGDWSAGGWIKYVFVQFHLAAENVLVTWYSSTLLLLASVMALLCFAADRREAATRNAISLGWLLLGAVLLLLSADEVGSIHERLGMLPALNFSGTEAVGWSRALAVPIGAVALFMVVFGFVRVRRIPWALVFLLLAAACYVANPILERTQMHLLATSFSQESWFAHDFSLHVEEGAELYGALCFLVATSLYLLGSSAPRAGFLDVPRTWVNRSLICLVAAMGVGWLLIQATGFTRIEADEGRPENWFPSALAILCACASSLWWHAMELESRDEHRSLSRVPAFFWCLAVYYGIWMKGWLGMEEFAALPLQAIASVGLLALSGMVAACLGQRVDSRLSQAGILAWFALLGAGLLTGPGYAVDLLEVGALAILLFVLQRELVVSPR